MAILPSVRPSTRTGVDRLSGLRPGQSARVSDLDPSLPAPIRRRLADLGVEEGAEITLLRRAPLGDPCVYRVRDYDLCLRRREADRVRCDTLPGA